MEANEEFEVKTETEDIVEIGSKKLMCYFCNLEFDEGDFLEHQNTHIKTEEQNSPQHHVLYTIEELSDFQVNEELGISGNEEVEVDKISNGKEPWITYCLPDFLPANKTEIGPDLSITIQAKRPKILQAHPPDRSKNICLICGLMYATHYSMAKHSGRNHLFNDYLKLVKSKILKETLAKHKCMCNMCFLNNLDLERHSIIHQTNFNVLIKCSMCLHSFSEASHVKDHVCAIILDKILWKQEQEECEKSNQIYKCAACSMNFESIDDFKSHDCCSKSGKAPTSDDDDCSAGSNLNIPAQIFKCGNCSKNFTSILEVKEHSCIGAAASKQNEKETETSIKFNSKFKCPKCPEKQFGNQATFIEHLKVNHNWIDDKQDSDTEIQPQEAAIKNGIKYFQKYLEEKQGVCEFEPVPIVRNSRKSKSRKSHSPVSGIIFNCPNCVEVFSSLSTFQKHLTVHENEECGYWSQDMNCDQNSFRIQCPRCPEKFLKQIFFLEHIKVIHGGQVINQGEENIRIILNSNQQSSSNQDQIYNMVPTVSAKENGWQVYQKYIAENQEVLPLDVELKIEDSSESDIEINQESLEVNQLPNDNEEEKTLKCANCLKEYSDSRELKIHMTSHHISDAVDSEISYVRIQIKDKSPIDIEVQDNLMICACRLAFLGLSELKTHLKDNVCSSQNGNEILSKKRKLSRNEAVADMILDFTE